MKVNPIIQCAYDVANRVLAEAGHVTASVLICDVGPAGMTVVFDDDKVQPGELVRTLRRAADHIDPENLLR